MNLSDDYIESFGAICIELGCKLGDINISQKTRDSLGGFTGIWRFISNAAKLFADYEETDKPDYDGDWISAIDDYSSSVAKELEKTYPDIENLHEKASAIISKYRMEA